MEKTKCYISTAEVPLSHVEPSTPQILGRKISRISNLPHCVDTHACLGLCMDLGPSSLFLLCLIILREVDNNLDIFAGGSGELTPPLSDLTHHSPRITKHTQSHMPDTQLLQHPT